MYFLNFFWGWDKKFFSIYDLTGENFYDGGGESENKYPWGPTLR